MPMWLASRSKQNTHTLSPSSTAPWVHNTVMMSRGLCMSKDNGSLNNGGISIDNIPRIESKRPQQWFMDGSDAELLPNKKQALDNPSSNSFAGVAPSNFPFWEHMSSFNSVPAQLNERSLDTESAQNINFGGGNVPPIDTGHLISGRDLFGNISSFGLSVCHSPKNSMFGIDYEGIRKVDVSEVRDSENFMPLSTGPSHTREVGVGTTAHSFNEMDNSSVSMGLTYDPQYSSVVTLGESCDREDNRFLPMSQSFNKLNDIKLAIRQKDDRISIMPISMSQVYTRDCSVSETNNCNYKVKASSTSTAQSSSKSEISGLSLGHPLEISESNIISFDGNHNDAGTSVRMICNYDLPMGQISGQRLDTFATNANPVIGTAQGSSNGSESASKRKEDRKPLKKVPLNNFPSNVRSLFSTGILDEVPVKYSAWSREVLHGIIKGAGYLCGCQSCNFSKVINAYEFERHAGCKTKHPNNHIYFDNGKTVYGVVQELRSTPQNMLFDSIQTITGSLINQKSFRLWKESFLAATRELQRIYSKDGRPQLF